MTNDLLTSNDNPAQITTYYRVGPYIAHELFEGELVVVNLDTGRYYAMSGTSSDIFTLCLQNASAAEIVKALSSKYTAAPSEIESATIAFLNRLQAEGIIQEANTRSSEAAQPALAPATPSPFAAPDFEVHNDMQDLLMLDPIHEVDTAGWPVMKPQQD